MTRFWSFVVALIVVLVIVADSSLFYADAFQRDPHFFQVWRSLQAYRDAFASGASRLVLTPGDGFLKLLHEPPQPDD
jgi:hypothetical protein